MKKFLSYFAIIILLGLGWSSISSASKAHHRSIPARVHFSGNLEGELEPCG